MDIGKFKSYNVYPKFSFAAEKFTWGCEAL